MSKQETHTQKPPYADYDAPHKFMAIEAIIGKRLIEHPHAICSYSGGSDSDIMVDLIERVRTKILDLPPIDYEFFDTGLEMEATRRHVKEVEKLYGITIPTYRPKKNIVIATREYGIPFFSKAVSDGLGNVWRKNVPLTVADEFAAAEDKVAKREELKARYPKCQHEINFLCSCNSKGETFKTSMLGISTYMLDFLKECPPSFTISNKCCTVCKKEVAHRVQKGYEMVITGERRAGGG